ncbi:ATP-binding protein [Streptomyces sp. NPDC058812]|uniref:ATP-binding protein n=1 Tax=unclassified Streptomyces TaxID=2593676 RepID=UPI00369CF9C1
MSTTRPYSPGDRGPEPSGASGASEGGVPGTGASEGGVPGTGESEGGVSAGQAAVIGASVPSSPSAASAPSSSSSPSPVGEGTASAGGGGRQGRRLSFDDQSGVVPLARDFTRQALYAWGWLPSATADQRAAAEDVLLVVSELVTNACLHAEGPDELWITCEKKVIRLEVSDRGTGQPAPRTPHRAGRPGGHGMFIVQRLCLDWGVVRTPGVAGKRVWAELGAPA